MIYVILWIVKKIKNELAWKPHYAFEEALTKTVAWYKG